MDADAWDARYDGADLVWSAGPNQFVAAELAGLTPGRAVDLAAGEGRNAIWLASLGWQVTAVDFSRVAVERGRRLAGGSSVDWVCADLLEWVPEPGQDLVVVAYLQLPADERRTVLQRGFDSLRVGGTLLLVAHDSSNLTEGTGGPQDPALLMTAEDVLADLGEAAYDVVAAGRVPREVPQPGGTTRTAYDARVRVVRSG
jgi:SAM-dependent methyltransferase